MFQLNFTFLYLDDIEVLLKDDRIRASAGVPLLQLFEQRKSNYENFTNYEFYVYLNSTDCFNARLKTGILTMKP